MKDNIKKFILGIMCVSVIAGALCGCSGNKVTSRKTKRSSATSTPVVATATPIPTPIPSPTIPPKTELSYGFLDYTMFDEYLANGVYRCGTDFEPGEYYTLSLYGASACFGAEDTPPDNGYEYESVYRKLNIKEGQYIRLTKGAVIMVKASLIDEADMTKYGIYEVGKDVAAGEYKCEVISDDYHTELGWATGIGGYQINRKANLNGEMGIECHSVWKDNPEYIKIENGDTLAINNLHITLVN